MKFPVSKIILNWHQPGLKRPNGISIDTMYNVEEYNFDLVQDESWRLWQHQVGRYKGSTLVKIKTKYLGMFEWCLGWFSHWTFPKGRSDDELLESFRRHVEEIQRSNYKAMAEGAKYEPWCLMGAEDRYRWDGPCHCIHCQEINVIRMIH